MDMAPALPCKGRFSRQVRGGGVTLAAIRQSAPDFFAGFSCGVTKNARA